jgi:hypothetical protein
MAAELQQLSDDLRFVRHAVEAQGKDINPIEARLVYGYWAAYVLVGYFLIDVAPDYIAGTFFMIGGIVGGFVSSAIGKRAAAKYGEASAEDKRRTTLHWAVGMPLVIASGFGLVAVIPALRGVAGSQVLLVMIGLVYYFWGVYVDRNFLWLGPVLIVGGLVVRFIPVYPWTCVGAVIALGLVVPPLLKRAPVTKTTTNDVESA